jgi:8-oxo-dGTP pyrophosphatase MutT (NUDIX family)
MPHLHEKIDFTVALFVVQDRKVLVVLHRKLGKWLPLGGHIELDEDPEQAALREAFSAWAMKWWCFHQVSLQRF